MISRCGFYDWISSELNNLQASIFIPRPSSIFCFTLDLGSLINSFDFPKLALDSSGASKLLGVSPGVSPKLILTTLSFWLIGFELYKFPKSVGISPIEFLFYSHPETDDRTWEDYRHNFKIKYLFFECLSVGLIFKFHFKCIFILYFNSRIKSELIIKSKNPKFVSKIPSAVLF